MRPHDRFSQHTEKLAVKLHMIPATCGGGRVLAYAARYDTCMRYRTVQILQAEVAEETEVLSLEAQSLSAKVSAALQRGLNAATDDLVAAQRKGKRAGGGGGSVGATKPEGNGEFEEEYGESVHGTSTEGEGSSSADQGQQQDFPASASGSASAASASASASESSKASGSSRRQSRLQALPFSNRGGAVGGGGRGG